jgi:hypothetical protein
LDGRRVFPIGDRMDAAFGVNGRWHKWPLAYLFFGKTWESPKSFKHLYLFIIIMTLVKAEGYTFYVEEEPIYDYDMDKCEIKTSTRSILFLSLKKQPYPCVKIDVSKDIHITIAELQLTNYYKSCSIKEKE